MTYTRTVGEEEYTGTAAMVTVNEPVPPYDPGPYSPPYTPSDNAAPREISVAVSGDKFIAERQPDGTHLLTLPHGTDVTALPVNFALPFGATMTPPNRGGQNFTAGPVTYVVTEEDKMTKETVILTVEFAPEAEPDPEPEPEPTPEPKEEPIPEPEPTPELPSGSGCASGLPALSLIGLLARRRGR